MVGDFPRYLGHNVVLDSTRLGSEDRGDAMVSARTSQASAPAIGIGACEAMAEGIGDSKSGPKSSLRDLAPRHHIKATWIIIGRICIICQSSGLTPCEDRRGRAAVCTDRRLKKVITNNENCSSKYTITSNVSVHSCRVWG